MGMKTRKDTLIINAKQIDQNITALLAALSQAITGMTHMAASVDQSLPPADNIGYVKENMCAAIACADMARIALNRCSDHMELVKSHVHM